MIMPKSKHFLTILIMIMVLSCHENYAPKPRGYLYLQMPEKSYTRFDSTCPFSFEYPEYGRVLPDEGTNTEPCWLNLVFPEYQGTLHLSYKPVREDLNKFTEDSHTLAYKHAVRADAIRETSYADPEADVYGILYDIQGNAASAVQFYLTDSSRHFLRGALYFKTQPRVDSLQPVIDFFREDIIHMIETLEWKRTS